MSLFSFIALSVFHRFFSVAGLPFRRGGKKCVRNFIVFESITPRTGINVDAGGGKTAPNVLNLVIMAGADSIKKNFY